jgi:hypothetical protein
MTNDATILALENQVGCYRRLAKLAEIQHEHVQQSRTEELLDVLSQRQDVLDQISRLEEAIAPARRQWNEFLGSLSETERQSAQGLLEETRRLLEQITVADRNDAVVLQQRKASLGLQISQNRSVRQVNRAYANAAYGRRDSQMDVQR